MQISIIKKSDVQEARRLDAEFFKPEYLEIEEKIINHKWNYLEDISLHSLLEREQVQEVAKRQDSDSQKVIDIRVQRGGVSALAK